MKVFVTGGSGFIGRHFIRMAQDHFDLLCQRRRDGPQTGAAGNVTWFEKKLDAITAEDLSGVEAVVHFASPGVSPKPATWEEMMYWNVEGLLQILDAGRLAGIRRFVLAGTFVEYGHAAERYERIPSDAPLEPTNAYAASKAAGFIAARAYCIEQKLELCYLRIASVFGEGQFAGNFWPSLRAAALAGEDFAMTSGEQIRDYVSVESAADAFLHAVTREDIRPGVPLILNVGSGRAVSMKEFAEYWWRKWGATGTLLVGALPYRPGEIMRSVPEVSPAGGL